MAFRFVHTADLHLDSPLRSLALRDAELADAVAAATRTAFTRIVDLCLAETVDALLIAGDLYDGANTSMKTAAFLASELRRLPPEIHVFILKGNHDATSRITDRLDLPSNVRTFDGRGQTHEIESRDGDAVAVHGVSFREPHLTESLLPKYKPPQASAINVGLMHTSLDGAAGHDPYAPVSAADLAARGYAYWALGHIHKRSVVRQDGAVIVMPGIPQGRHVNEDGPKSVTLASLGADGVVDLEERFVAPAEFRRLDIDLGPSVTDLNGAIKATEAALAEARRNSKAADLIVRLTLRPTSDFGWRLRREAEQFEELARIAARGQDAWIESIEIAAAADGAREDLGLPDLAAELRSVLDDPAFAVERDRIAGGLTTFLAGDGDLTLLLGNDADMESQTIKALAEAGVADAIVRLSQTEAD